MSTPTRLNVLDALSGLVPVHADSAQGARDGAAGPSTFCRWITRQPVSQDDAPSSGNICATQP